MTIDAETPRDHQPVRHTRTDAACPTGFESTPMQKILRIIPTRTLNCARQIKLHPWLLLPAGAWFTLALSILLMLSGLIKFTWHSSSGIHAWVNVHQYSKTKDIFWFLAAVGGVPMVMFIAWTVWIYLSAAVIKFAKCPPERCLKISALCQTPLFFLWQPLVQLQQQCLPTIIWTSAISLMMTLAIIPLLRLTEKKSWWNATVPVAEQKNCSEQESRMIPAPKRRYLHLFRRINKIACLVFLFILLPATVYRLRYNPNINRRIDLFHEGEFMIPVHEFENREPIPYRDIYLQHGLLHNLGIPWLGTKIFGNNLAGIRRIHAYIAPLGFVAFYYLVLMSAKIRIIPAVLFLILSASFPVNIPARSFFGIMSIAVIAATYHRQKGFEPKTEPAKDENACRLRCGCPGLSRICLREWPFILAGALASTSLLHSLEIGLYTFTATTIFLLASLLGETRIEQHRKLLQILCFIVGAAGILLPFSLYLLFHGAIDDFCYNAWIQCFHQLETWGLPFPDFFRTVKPLLESPCRTPFSTWIVDTNTRWFYAPAVLTLSAALLAWRAMSRGFWKSTTAPELLLLTLAGCCFFRTNLGRSDNAHIHYGIAFAAVITIFFCDRLIWSGWNQIKIKTKPLPVRLIALSGIVAGLTLAASIICWKNKISPNSKNGIAAIWNKMTRQTSVDQPDREPLPYIGNIRIPANQITHIRQLCEYITANTDPGEYIFDFSNQAGILFFARRKSASRYFQACYASTPAMQEELVRDLRKHKTKLIIYRSGGWFDRIDGVPNKSRLPIIDEFINENYYPAHRIKRTEIWLRKKAPR